MFSPKCSFRIRRNQVWLFLRISTFPVQALFTLHYIAWTIFLVTCKVQVAVFASATPGMAPLASLAPVTWFCMAAV